MQIACLEQNLKEKFWSQLELCNQSRKLLAVELFILGQVECKYTV